MSLAKLVSELGPVVLNLQIADAKRRGEDTTFLEEYGTHLINGLSDSIQAQEHQKKDAGKAHFLAHIAVDLLRDSGAGTELTERDIDNAVRLATRLVQQAEKAAAE